jgi:hypothetical protein
MSDWRNDPATKKQKDKLLFFGCTFDDGITKGQAHDAIDKCVATFPEMEKEYQNRPATKEQMKAARAYLKKNGEEIEDYADNGKFLTYAEAKEIEEDWKQQQEEAELEELESEYIIDVGDWAEIYPGLTWNRVQAAAKSLDKSSPGWRDEKNHIDIMVAKVAEQNPQLLERWRNKKTPKQKRGGRKAKSSSFGALVFLIIVIWVIWKFISK